MLIDRCLPRTQNTNVSNTESRCSLILVNECRRTEHICHVNVGEETSVRWRRQDRARPQVSISWVNAKAKTAEKIHPVISFVVSARRRPIDDVPRRSKRKKKKKSRDFRSTIFENIASLSDWRRTMDDVMIEQWSHSYDIDIDKKSNNAVETSDKPMSKPICSSDWFD